MRVKNSRHSFYRTLAYRNYWRHETGRIIPIRALEDSHLQNILEHIWQHHRATTTVQFVSLIREARKRKLLV